MRPFLLGEGEGAGAAATAGVRAGVEVWVRSAGGDLTAGGVAGGRPAGAAAATEPSAILAITSPTGTSSPAVADTSVKVPSASASTSIIALSVSTSISTSPRFTGSPACFSHRTTKPVFCAMPSAGMITSRDMEGLPLHHEPGELRDNFWRGHGKILKRRRKRHRHVHRADPPHRRIEIVERLLIDAARDLRCHSKALMALVDDDRSARLSHRSQDRLLVQRHDGSRIDHLGADAVLIERLGRLPGDLHHRGWGDHRDVRPP